jgi:Na+/H+ antiporter NhaD/arsenite permease-like protein
MPAALPFATTTIANIPPVLVLPFVLLLLLIATMPLTPEKVKHMWERFYPHIALGLGLAVAAYYYVMIPGGETGIAHTLTDYFSFICLIGSLFVVSGGVHIHIKGEGTPFFNMMFLAFGAIVANLIGTTGASMLLIRPWIRMNQYRFTPFHVVFFIFVVSNCGGALTPIGDPPLFLGYLNGVPFFWLFKHAVFPWLTCLGLILTTFYFFDRWSFNKVDDSLPHDFKGTGQWYLHGGVNLVFLAIIIAAVFLPEKFFAREIVMISAAFTSFLLTPREVHEENKFNFAPLKEVAWLFVGIFLTMMPALDYLGQHGKDFGIAEPLHYYFATGSLSSVLDNAPTYLNFLKLAQSTLIPGSAAAAEGPGAVHHLLNYHPSFIITVSLGAVFFGAMTYIGNGPNFMVKSIAENAGVQAPSFFGYIFKYSLPVLLPILVLVGWMFT